MVTFSAAVKADRAAVGGRGWLAVVRLGHHEAAAVVRVGQPALARLGAGLPADRGKQRIVKLLRPGDVVAPDHYVAEHSVLSSAEPNDRHAAPYRLGQHAGTGDHRAKSGIRRLLRKRCPLPKARFGVILGQAITGKSGAEEDLPDPVRQTLDERSSLKCPAILGQGR